MLEQVAPGVLVHQSECILSNSVIIQGADGVLLVDPGLTREEMTSIAHDIRAMGEVVAAAFATHPDWDHVLWHPEFGTAPRWGTRRCFESLQELLARPHWTDLVAEGLPPEIAADVPMEMLGGITPLDPGAATIPWSGPSARILEHRAHAPGHAAVLVPEARLLVAGDMLSDVLVPMLDLQAEHPVDDYLHALDLIEETVGQVDIVIPGHGTVAHGGELTARIRRDRAYVQALRDGGTPEDPRIGASAEPGWEWVSDVHAWQVQSLRGPA